MDSKGKCVCRIEYDWRMQSNRLIMVIWFLINLNLLLVEILPDFPQDLVVV